MAWREAAGPGQTPKVLVSVDSSGKRHTPNGPGTGVSPPPAPSGQSLDENTPKRPRGCRALPPTLFFPPRLTSSPFFVTPTVCGRQAQGLCYGFSRGSPRRCWGSQPQHLANSVFTEVTEWRGGHGAGSDPGPRVCSCKVLERETRGESSRRRVEVVPGTPKERPRPPAPGRGTSISRFWPPKLSPRNSCITACPQSPGPPPPPSSI